MKNVSSVFGNNKSCSGWGQDIVFFVFLFYICLFPGHRDSDQSLINEDGLQTWFNDFKQALQLRMNAVRTVWEVYDLCLTNPGLNLPAGVWTLLSFCICTTPQFHDPRATLRSSCSVSNGPLWGNENQSPQETPIFPLTEHVLIYFLLKLRMCSIAVIVEEGACGLLWFMWFLCGLSGCQRSDRSHIYIYYSSLGLAHAQRVDLEFCTSDMHVCTVHRAKRWEIFWQ